MGPKRKKNQNQVRLDQHFVVRPGKKLVNREEERMKNIDKVLALHQKGNRLLKQQKELVQELLELETKLKNIGIKPRSNQRPPQLIEPMYIAYSKTVNPDQKLSSIILGDHDQIHIEFQEQVESSFTRKINKYTGMGRKRDLFDIQNMAMEVGKEEEKEETEEERWGIEEKLWKDYGQLDPKYLKDYTSMFVRALKQIQNSSDSLSWHTS